MKKYHALSDAQLDVMRKAFHVARKNLFKAKTVTELGGCASATLLAGEQFQEETDLIPMAGYDTVKAELIAIADGAKHWPAIKTMMAQEPTTAKYLAETLGLTKEVIGTFLYRITQSGVVKKEKKGRENVFTFAKETLDNSAMRKEWTSLWEEPYKHFQRQY